MFITKDHINDYHHLAPICGEKDLLCRLPLLVLLLHRGDVPLRPHLPDRQLLLLVLLVLLWLVVEQDLPSIVALVEEVKIIEHCWIIEHEVHDLMTKQPRELKKEEIMFYQSILFPPVR